MDRSQSADPTAPGGAPALAPQATHSAAPAARRTLAPEWLGLEGPKSAASITLSRIVRGEPVPRRAGARAELESLSARLSQARKTGDTASERVLATDLARALVQRGSELDQATRLARRALLLGDDPVLREELSGWFALLGESALAAATLRPLLAGQSGREACQLLVRIGTLLARGGEATAAREIFDQALLQDPIDPNPAELAAALGAWEPEAVSAEDAARFYLTAADRRERLGERAAAFENVLRAFEMAPDSALATERLARLLTDRGRAGAADEVRREHARHAGPGARSVHLRRLLDALTHGDLPRALGAALDAHLDAEVDSKRVLGGLSSRPPHSREPQPIGFDELLERLGLAELLAARLELAGEQLTGRDRSRVRLALARLYSGTLGRPDRAVDAWLDAFVADPGCQEARLALARYADARGDHAPLVEALVRVAESGGTSAEHTACLRDLLKLADRLGEPGLAHFAAKRLDGSVEERAELDELLARLEPRAKAADEALAAARAELSDARELERIEPLARLAALFASRPDQADGSLPVLLELVELTPDEPRFQAGVDRLLVRQGRLEELGAFYERQLGRARTPGERVRLGLALASLRRQGGDLEGALAVLRPLLAEPACSQAAVCATLLLAGQCGDEVLRARALLRLAVPLAAPLRAMLSAVAGELLLNASELEEARRAVDQAVAADPSLARPIAARAAVGLASAERWGAEAMERAMGVVVPRATLCAALAGAYDKLGEPLLALAFGQRRIALRPGDLEAARDRLARTLAMNDGTRLGDALAWLFAQPQPLEPIADLVADALRALATLDPGRSAALSRRALDVLGARLLEIRLAVLSVADITGDRAVAIAALERWLASGAASSDRGEILLDLARRRRATAEPDLSAHSLMRAVREGAWGTAVLAELDVAPPVTNSDGEIALLVARAESLSSLSEADQRGTALAWRELGAAYWDLAGDTESALRAWERASVLDPEAGIENFASDLVAFAGSELALARLEEFAARRTDPKEGARVLALAAALALESDKPSVALRTSVRALELDASRTDVLSVIERSAQESDIDVLERTYEVLASGVLGRYGERSVHYRAARQLEKRHAGERALAHAVRAFEAVPSEGIVFVTLARLAEQLGETAEVVRVLDRIAARTSDPNARAAWLQRAALLAGNGEEGLRLRIDVLLRALSVRPDRSVLRSIGEAMRALVERAPDESDGLALRLERAFGAVSARLEGPEGARFAILAARILLESFGEVAPALAALDRALDCDADIEEYLALGPSVEKLAPGAGPFVARVAALASDRMGNAGPNLLALGARLAEERGETEHAVKLLVHGARKAPEDRELVRRAEQAARELGDPALLGLVLDAIPARDRLGALLDLADLAERAGELQEAADILEGARSEPLAADDAARITALLVKLYDQLGQPERVEELLEEQLRDSGGDIERRALIARELANRSGERDLERALVTLELVLRDAARDAGLLNDYLALARKAGDRGRTIRALSGLLELSARSEESASILRELAELEELAGDLASASARWAELLRIAPDDPPALAALEREAERRGDYETLVQLLARRASLATTSDEVRRVRLRRASVLEHRLGRAEEARAELEALTAATGDHWSVLRVLADLNERLGAPVRAAPLWLRASAVTTDREEAADLACRACEAYLAGSDVDSARRVLDGLLTWRRTERVLGLSVEVERRRESPLSLAEALDDLALASSAEPEQRAALLVEAARASLAAGATDEALVRAERAARLAPDFAAAQLLYRTLDYQRRGAPSGADATRAIDELAVLEDLSDSDAELRAFLLAEARDNVPGGESGVAELEESENALGPRPLIAVALAERLARSGEAERALPYFDGALGGDLRGFRQRSRVALAAAEAARTRGERERARGYVEIAAEDPDLREHALVLGRELQNERSTAPRADRFRPSLDPGALVALERAPTNAGRYSERPPPEAQEERVVAVRTSIDPRVESLPVEYEPLQPELPQQEPSETRRSVEPPAVEPAPHNAGRYSLRAHAERPSSRPPESEAVDTDDSSSRILKLDPREAELYTALADGSVDAGNALVQRLEGRPERTHDLVAVCRRLTAALPGDLAALARLRDAALADKNASYARAVEHAMHVIEPGTPRIAPPPLSDQVEQPDAVRALLLREQASNALEALAVVWEGAEHVFRRDPSTYGVTGLERVPLSAPTPLARVYSAAARALGMLRTPLFQRRSTGPITVSLALLSPPAIVLSGDVRQDSAELAYQLGAMLIASMPQYALLLGSPESQARAVLGGLGFAFGPPDMAQNPSKVPNLAEVLWESIPARLQRRLRELCSVPGSLDYDTAIRAARLAGRRAGLFVSGDLRVALREACVEDGIPPTMLETTAKIGELCASSAAVRSLLSLATSAEYAQTRWQLGRGAR